jgi:hypothetical protein
MFCDKLFNDISKTPVFKLDEVKPILLCHKPSGMEPASLMKQSASLH